MKKSIDVNKCTKQIVALLEAGTTKPQILEELSLQYYDRTSLKKIIQYAFTTAERKTVLKKLQGPLLLKLALLIALIILMIILFTSGVVPPEKVFRKSISIITWILLFTAFDVYTIVKGNNAGNFKMISGFGYIMYLRFTMDYFVINWFMVSFMSIIIINVVNEIWLRKLLNNHFPPL